MNKWGLSLLFVKFILCLGENGGYNLEYRILSSCESLYKIVLRKSYVVYFI